MTDLGTLDQDPDSQALAINSEGQVVGWSGNQNGALRAFLWQDGAMTDLNTLLPAGSGWQLLQANTINACGDISGVGIHNGVTAAFLLTKTCGQEETAQADCESPAPVSDSA